jgi:serine/threonine protein kinase
MADPREDTGVDRPRVFGDYHLLTTLARGGMGAIHLAKRLGFRPDIQLFCVVKTLRRSRHDVRALQKRFEDEARVVVMLNHRAICHVFDVGIVDGEHYLAMELIEGISLRALWSELRRAQTPLSPGLALYVMDEVLDALSYAHTHKDPATGAPLHIVHRDVSPQNIMLSFQGGVKLIDFGLVSSSVNLEHTEGGLVGGKLEYMSPEQARGEPLHARSDVFSAAVVLFELLTGRRFYGEFSKGAVQHHLVEGGFTPSFEGMDPRVRDVLTRALAHEPKDRTESAAQLQSELSSCGVARASSRDLRELLQRVAPQAQAELAALQRGFRDVGVEDAAHHSTVTHLARASEGAGSITAPLATETDTASSSATRSEPSEPTAALLHRTPAPPARSSPWLAAAIAVAVAAVLTSAWVVWRRQGADTQAPLSDARDAARLGDAGSFEPDAGALQLTAPFVPAPDAGLEVPTDDGPTDDTTPRAARKPRTPPAKPPTTPLPDLAAQFAYLERWCTARTPACAKRVLGKREQVATLDVIGLRALRQDAESCVLACRR